ncbi:hypothetical protein CEXT_711261 [Caerostris extrusa]|uniref:Uncharacterized protein n=1 Tax=Caerostris extrusa TaxID=172846 RepID=A0AAV4PTR6_CAEEX|nr:hypothetical protein CEXT_711261 [Caerostris extrusa]
MKEFHPHLVKSLRSWASITFGPHSGKTKRMKHSLSFRNRSFHVKISVQFKMFTVHCVSNREREKHYGEDIVNAELNLAVKRKTMRKSRGKKKKERGIASLITKNNFGTEKLMKAQSSVEENLVVKRKTMRKRRNLAVKHKTMRKRRGKKKKKRGIASHVTKNNFGTEKLMKAQSSEEQSKRKEMGDDVEDDVAVKRKTMRKRRGKKKKERGIPSLVTQKQFRHRKVDGSSEERATE